MPRREPGREPGRGGPPQGVWRVRTADRAFREVAVQLRARHPAERIRRPGSGTGHDDARASRADAPIRRGPLYDPGPAAVALPHDAKSLSEQTPVEDARPRAAAR